jgi:hypothetical protein
MSLSLNIASFFSHAFHVRPAQIKHAPWIKPGHEEQAAKDINNVTGPLAVAAAMALPAVAENALTVHPDQLKGAPAITDHQAAADFVNGHIAAVLSP